MVNKKDLFRQLGYEPHSAAQWAVHNSTARFKVPCCGRRWGKSLSAGQDMTAAVVDISKPNGYYWIVGPTYKLGEKEFRVVYKNLVEKLRIGDKLKKQYNVNQGNMRIEMPWGTVCEVVSAEKPDSLLGEGLDGVIMSEAAAHKADTWDRFIEPALSDKRGWAIFPSTPKGFNWYQGLWQLGQLEQYNDYESWRLPTWTNTVRYPGGRDDPEILRVKERVSPAWFSQEYGAEFTSYEGQIYEEWNDNIHVRRINYEPSWKNFWAVDFGFSVPWVCLDVMVDQSDNVYVWREYQERFKATYEHALYLRDDRENPDGFHVNAIFADGRGADEIATMELVLGKVWGCTTGWSMGVEAVKRNLKIQPDGMPKLFVDPGCVELIRQMKALRKPEVKEGSDEKSAQWKYDDHGPDALRYFFSEYFVEGAGVSLADVYGTDYRGSEAETFFTLHSEITLDSRIGY
jgi:hypothetical protein